jgi:phosphatidylserine/phosphatidylglycerophosphate/cardiolipin synthase-like enzyme
MERLTESSLLADGHDPQASGWFTDNVLHPFENGTGLAQIYNNFVSDDKKIAPAYVPQAKTLSTDWAIHTLSSATGAVLTYAAVGKATNMGLSAISSAAGLEGAAARTLTSMSTANIVGAGLYDLAKAPNPGETRLGNAAGSVAAFGVFAAGNELLGASKTIANSAVLGGLGRIGVGMAGGLTSLETSHLVSKALGVKSEVSWDDRINSMASGGFINVTMPIVQKGLSDLIDGARHPQDVRIVQPEEPTTKLLNDSQDKLPQLDLQRGPRASVKPSDVPEDAQKNAAARPPKGNSPAGNAELPELILLKQQFDESARQAQIEQVASRLAEFIGTAKKSVATAVYDFRLKDPTVENTVINAYNKAAEAGLDVKIAFFQPEPHSDGARGIVNVAEPTGDSGQVNIAHGPSPELLAKLSPKITVQTVSVSDGLPPDPFAAAQQPGRLSSRLVDLQSGKNGNLSGDVSEAGIKGGGHLMHNKYVVLDAGTKDGKVWTGSTNFTDDAFGSQDNNIIILKSQTLAGAYAKDFAQMWKAGTLVGTGADLHTTAKVGDGSITVAFSPGDGQFIDAEYAKRLAAAQDSVHIASMVISSPEMLKALVDDINRGVKVTGIYDGPQMDQVERNWSKFPSSAEKLEMWKQVKEVLVRKESHPYTPNGIHDFLHDKMFVVDGKNAGTGSFNFSKNATMNAENVVMMDNVPQIAQQYTNYIDDLVKTYDGKPMVGEPVVTKPVTPQLSAEEAHSTLKTMLEQGKIPHGKFVDSVAGQNYPLTAKQLAVVLDIIAKAQAK